MKKRLFAIALFMIVVVHAIYGQNITSRLRIMRGARLDFIFNSYSKYNNGITYAGYTELQLTYTDTTANGGHTPGAGWVLTVKALQSGITGDATSNQLALETIQLKVDLNGTVSSPEPLSTIEKVIASGNYDGYLPADKTITETVLISYDCGTDIANKLLNKKEDYYFVDLVFTLKPQ